ncbi:S1C family serine protease [Nocardioides sp. GXZ039]|uniref:S1C family serine protease n=1 Tax=Nocardioides sp. GXZ039 TaxID=3136018 RepID=UPI0030F43EBF
MNDTPSRPDGQFDDYRDYPPPPTRSSQTPPSPSQNPYAPQHTQQLPLQGPPPAPRGPASAAGHPSSRPPARGRKGFAAAVVAAALVVGAGGGLGGAALYDAMSGNDTASNSSSAPVTTSKVVSTPDQDAADGSVEQVAKTVLPSVVKLDVAGAQGVGSGSGIVLSSDGLILTNDHVASVAENGGTITASFSDGSHAKATIVGTDPLTDTALVKAEGVSGLTPITIGESGKVEVGQEVVAIGSPFGLDATVTSGIVSALNRPIDVSDQGQSAPTVYPAIQTDAAINPGNSGGPLVDMNGHLIGINASIKSAAAGGGEAGSIGLGFAIPIDEVLPVVDQMKAGETPTHARLGVSVQDAGAGAAAGAVVDGAKISQIGSGSAAGKAGLQDGDVITKVDDTMITGSDSLIATVRSYRPGDKVTITYERNGSEHTTQLTLDSDAGTSS